MASLPRALTEFLAPYPPGVRRTMRESRAALKKRFTLAHEVISRTTSAVCVGFAYTADARGVFVNLAAYSDHVTLVFTWGIKLADPEKLLSGAGKQVRHLRIAGVEDLEVSAVAKLIFQAEAFAPRPLFPSKPTTIVKVYAGPKRRPAKA
jgi:hypothetical protein